MFYAAILKVTTRQHGKQSVAASLHISNIFLNLNLTVKVKGKVKIQGNEKETLRQDSHRQIHCYYLLHPEGCQKKCQLLLNFRKL